MSYWPESEGNYERVFVVVLLLFYVHGKQLRSCRDGNYDLTGSWENLNINIFLHLKGMEEKLLYTTLKRIKWDKYT